MHIWPILFAFLLLVLIAGVTVLHAADGLIQSLGDDPKWD
jgi:hypothetical protein